MTEPDAGQAITIDNGAVRVAVCNRCEWRIASTSLAAVWTAAARHLRAFHGDPIGGRKALRASLMARRREQLTYVSPHGNPDDDSASRRTDTNGRSRRPRKRVGKP
jgi:hypothetical protein